MPASINKQLESFRANFFWRSEENDKKISWVKWEKTLASKNKGGIGIGSLKAFNEALLLKWRWRFYNNPNGIWVKCIKALHGEDGGFGVDYGGFKIKGVWSRIVGNIKHLHETSLIHLSCMKKTIGDGASVKIWKDVWIGNEALMYKYPRLFLLETNKECSMKDCYDGIDWVWRWRRIVCGGIESQQLSALLLTLSTVVILPKPDMWRWEFDGSNEFTVAMVRNFLDEARLGSTGINTRWSKYMPRKVNIFLWRVMLNRLPTRIKLVDKNIDIPSTLYPICESDIETIEHCLIGCDFATQVRVRVSKWCDMQLYDGINILEALTHIDNVRLTRVKKKVMEAIVMTMWWTIWNYRNCIIFGSKTMRKDFIFDSIVSSSYHWFVFRFRKLNVNWVEWLKNPIVSISL